MVSKSIQSIVESSLSLEILSFKRLHGGDINDVFLLRTNAKDLVIKLNTNHKLKNLFAYEKEGLETLRKTHTFKIPKALLQGTTKNTDFLILEYIDQKTATNVAWKSFGEQLAHLHQYTSNQFGFPSSNYIGSLPQHNNYCDTALSFYITQRLIPQFKLASLNGYTFKEEDVFYIFLEKNIPEEKPALIHGDLWSGNYLIAQNETPCLIDPSVSFFHREMDIAMMHLFGGFHEEIFQTYNEIFPLKHAWKERLQLWQLYYLLVHLNLFGNSYYPSVKNILSFYTH